MNILKNHNFYRFLERFGMGFDSILDGFRHRFWTSPHQRFSQFNQNPHTPNHHKPFPSNLGPENTHKTHILRSGFRSIMVFEVNYGVFGLLSHVYVDPAPEQVQITSSKKSKNILNLCWDAQRHPKRFWKNMFFVVFQKKQKHCNCNHINYS